MIWFWEQIFLRGIRLIKIDTMEQLGDMFTKWLPMATFEYLRKKLMRWHLLWACTSHDHAIMWSCNFMWVTWWLLHSHVLCSQLRERLAKIISAHGTNTGCVCAMSTGCVCCRVHDILTQYCMIFFIYLVRLHALSGTGQHFVIELFKW